MTVGRINSNVHFLTEQLAEEIRAIDGKILFNVSYDGAGYHDWMRNRKGAEKDLLSKIKILVDKGFHVCAAMTLNRVNLDAAEDSLKKLEELGVQEFRIIRTSETPRWLLNAKDACLTFEEYYDAMTDLCRKFASEEHTIDLNIFHFVIIRHRYRCYIWLRSPALRKGMIPVFLCVQMPEIISRSRHRAMCIPVRPVREFIRPAASVSAMYLTMA